MSLACPFLCGLPLLISDDLSEVDALLLLGLVLENWSTISMSTNGRARKNTTAQYRRDRNAQSLDKLKVQPQIEARSVLV